MRIKTAILLYFIFGFIFSVNAQDYSYKSYNFIRYDKNKIDFPGDSSQFGNLFSKLDKVIKTGEGKINVIHIGGSHIQAGRYTEVVRKKMQTFFPGLNGGRGLLFPFRMAKTNGPKNYSISYTGNWETCRNVEKKQCNLGITGISASTTEKNTSISIKFKEDYIHYDFNKIIVFNKINEATYKIEPVEINCLYEINEFPEKGYTEIITEDYLQTIKLKFVQTDTIQNNFTLYGIYLENDNPGVVYNDVGINGASVPSFLKCNLLEQQTEVLKPDLVILSLGTNDTYTTNFRPDYYKNNYMQLIKSIKKASPETAILFTVPNDSYYRRKNPNENTAKAEDVMYKLAEELGCGVWDFYKIMGGYNSAFLWHKEKLMQNDLIHFTKKGYQIKGDLLFSAILKAYGNHIDYINKL
ncbi:MAG: GDSL-type esterase/lipase family protein [Bacteroidales bacterium]|nr:GDSL-type esterase/lipase family protein [Bacteroidales bacterium]